MNRSSTDPHPSNGVHRDDDELAAAWVFDELDPGAREAFEARFASEPELRERCEAFAATSRRIRSEHASWDVLSPAIHESLAKAGRRARPRLVRGLRVGLAAATLAAVTLFLLDASRRASDSREEFGTANLERRIVARVDGSGASARNVAIPDPTATPAVPFTVPADSAANGSTLLATLRDRVDEESALHPRFEHPSILNISESTVPNLSESNGVPEAMFFVTGSGSDPAIRARVEAFYEALGVPLQPMPEYDANESIHIELESTRDFFFGGFLAPNLPAPAAEDAANLLRECERRPNERPADMYFRFWGDNGFERAATDPLSTFAIDVDGASYALAREYLERGWIPEKAQIRTEEFLNYFRPDVAAPVNGALAVVAELAPSPFSADRARSLLRITLRAREVAPGERRRQNLMLVVDVSGSMKEGNRLELVKHALRLLTAKLAETDRVGITTFSDDARLVLPMTTASDRATIESAIHAMTPNGSTNAAAGLGIGFAELAANLDVEAANRVVLLSDGVANVGATDAESILASVAEQRSKGVYLSTIGVGIGNHNDVLLEQLADRGDGACAYVGSDEDAKRAIVDRFSGAFVTLARNVKIQVEFDPNQVERYRLLGYENRAVADADFRDDAIDGGELGAGEQVTALYEIEPTPSFSDSSSPAASVRVRWLPPHGSGDTAVEAPRPPIARFASFESASPGFRRTALVAQFAELLRRSTHARGDSIDALLAKSTELASEIPDPDFDEFVRLVQTSRDLIASSLPNDDPLTEALDAVRKNRILKAEIEDLAAANRADILKQLEEENRRLEELLKKLLEK